MLNFGRCYNVTQLLIETTAETTSTRLRISLWGSGGRLLKSIHHTTAPGGPNGWGDGSLAEPFDVAEGVCYIQVKLDLTVEAQQLTDVKRKLSLRTVQVVGKEVDIPTSYWHLDQPTGAPAHYLCAYSAVRVFGTDRVGGVRDLTAVCLLVLPYS